jgi:hypothetical protein
MPGSLPPAGVTDPDVRRQGFVPRETEQLRSRAPSTVAWRW